MGRKVCSKYLYAIWADRNGEREKIGKCMTLQINMRKKHNPRQNSQRQHTEEFIDAGKDHAVSIRWAKIIKIFCNQKQQLMPAVITLSGRGSKTALSSNSIWATQ